MTTLFVYQGSSVQIAERIFGRHDNNSSAEFSGLNSRFIVFVVKSWLWFVLLSRMVVFEHTGWDWKLWSLWGNFILCVCLCVWGQIQMDTHCLSQPLVLDCWSSHMFDEGHLRHAVTQSRGRTGGHRVGNMYRWALLSSYPQLLFDFEI